MLLLASTQAVIDKLRGIPREHWTKLGMGFGILVIGCLLLRRYSESRNKLFINVVLAMVCCIVFSHWVFERGEPKFLTPLVDLVAQSGFFVPKSAQK